MKSVLRVLLIIAIAPLTVLLLLLVIGMAIAESTIME